MSWPTRADFCNMLQNPRFAFRDKSLHDVTVECHKGLPRARAGSFADVYKATLKNGQSLAVRVFASDLPERRERYKAIHEHLIKQKLSFLVPFTYADEGMRGPTGKWYPLITMDWVKGDTLFDWLGRTSENGDGKAISRLTDRWRGTIGLLDKAQIAHGDLQHANIMVTDSEEVRLVDYDGMCVPVIKGREGTEAGVEPYQHPERRASTPLSMALDNFSSIFIYLGLRALAADPKLWRDFVVKPAYDKMLFRKDDFDNPGSSQIFSRLHKSADGDVQRLARQLAELWRTPYDKVPRLEDLLFSFDQVKVLLDQRDFDAAVALIGKSGKTAKDAPPALQPLIEDAHKRIAAFSQLTDAVAKGDEPAMAKLAVSPLLQGFPKAAEILTEAADAPSVAAVIQKLDSAKTNQRGRELVQVWDASKGLLTKPKGKLRKSAQAYANDVESWRERNNACDGIQALLGSEQPDPDELLSRWKRVVELGGHPECDPSKDTIARAVDRGKAWARFVAVKPAVTEASDRAIVGVWNESLFHGWPPAEAQRARYDAAKKRIGVADAFLKQSQAAKSEEKEKELLQLASDIPPGYMPAIADRCALAKKSLAALEALREAVKNEGDVAIAEASAALEKLSPHLLSDATIKARVTLAKQRQPLIAKLRAIPVSYDVKAANRWDGELLAAWNDAVLSQSRDAALWRDAWIAATRRQELLKQLAAAIAGGDSFRAHDIAADPILEGYQHPAATKRFLDAATDAVVSVRGLMAALDNNDREGFRKHFSVDTVRSVAGSLTKQWSVLRDLVVSEVLPARSMGLAPPIAARPLEVGSSFDPQVIRCVLRWKWPEPRFTDECHVAVCRNRPQAKDTPDTVRPLQFFTMTRDMYQTAGGYRVVNAEKSWSGCYVVVWSRLDLGAEVFWSEPLVLGVV